MIKIKTFTFNPFQENTFVVSDETKEAVIFDPGCHNPEEKAELVAFIEKEDLKPVKLINTHCHVDHVFGNAYIHQKYKLSLEAHPEEDYNLKSAVPYADAMGLKMPVSPEIEIDLSEQKEISFGNSKLEIISTPGHSAGGLSFYSKEGEFVIAGDCLFHSGVGRVDLPGGDADVLIESIKEKLFVLPEDTVVYSGHGPKTTIGYEKMHNPFVGVNALYSL